MTAIALLPDDPQQLEVDQLRELAQQIVAWADSIEDVTVVRDAAAKWAAITEYVKRKSLDGVAEAEGALRRLEVRIGRLNERRGAGRPPANCPHTDNSVPRQRAAEFEVMAKNADVVEDVIAASTDANPPSRRRVLGEITRRQFQAETSEIRERWETIRPKFEAAVAELPPDPDEGDWLVTFVYRGNRQHIASDLPLDSQLISITEAAA